MSGTTESPSERVYLDTNVLIEAFEGRGRLSELLDRLLLTGASTSVPRFVTSELTIAELLVQPLRLDRQDLVHVYEEWTSGNPQLEVTPISRSILIGAAKLRARDMTVKLPDAIHVMTAVERRCRFLLTGDRRVKSDLGVEVLPLGEPVVEQLLRALA